MKLSRIHSSIALCTVLWITACNPSTSSDEDSNKTNSDTTQNTVDDTSGGTTNEVDTSPVIGFTSVDFRSVPDDYYASGSNLLIGVAADVTDPDGDNDIVMIGFVFEDESNERIRITLKDTRPETLIEDQQNDYDESLSLYYDFWYFYNAEATTWNVRNLYFFAIDSEGNEVTKDYVISAPNGESITTETFVYSPITYAGDTTNGVAALTAPEISLFTWNSSDDSLALEFNGDDSRIRSTLVKFYYYNNVNDYSTTTVSLADAVYDNTTQSYSFDTNSIALDVGQTNSDITEARMLVTDDPDQELPEYSNWWHYQSWSTKVSVSDI